MQKSSIEWTDMTWGITRGCDEITPGCDNCYAKRFAERWRGTEGHAYEQGFDLRLVPHLLSAPLKIAASQKIFVNSMSDLFHKDIPIEFIQDVGQVMQQAQWHVFQVLTKRSSRMRNLLNGSIRDAAIAPNIWWGVSVEDRKHGLPRIRHLQDATHAQIRWLSIEPLLEDLGDIDLQGIHGVVVGGDSGPGARPMEKTWVESIQRQCEEQQVPFFFKQWGGVLKKKTGRKLNGRTYNAQPQHSQQPVLPRSQRLHRIEQAEERSAYWLHTKDEKIRPLVFRKSEKETVDLNLDRLRKKAT